MLVVMALDGHPLLRRGEPISADRQRAKVRVAAQALAPVAASHQLVIVHGNGPQMDLLALQGAAYANVEACPLDVLGAETEAMIGYMLEQELGNLLGDGRPFATILTAVEVDACDPAFRNPSTFIGPVYLREEADRMAASKGWVFRPDGDKWRRVVASPEPRRISELRPIKWLLERNTIVIAAGGGGIPAMHERRGDRKVVGVECVINKDLAAELLARELGADLFILLTDADAVYVDRGRPTQKAIRRASPHALRAISAAGPMDSSVEAACRFAKATGNLAALGALADIEKILAGEAGTIVSPAESEIVFAPELADAARH